MLVWDEFWFNYSCSVKNVILSVLRIFTRNFSWEMKQPMENEAPETPTESLASEKPKVKSRQAHIPTWHPSGKA